MMTVQMGGEVEDTSWPLRMIWKIAPKGPDM